MWKLLLLLGIAALGCKAVFGRWPWEYLLADNARDAALARARETLGVDAGADHAQIVAAHKKLIAIVHPDKGGSNDQVHEANAARDLLLNALPQAAQHSEGGKGDGSEAGGSDDAA
jgi:DnaJ-class molecular chaperone